MSTMTTFVGRGSLWILNSSSIPTLLERLSPSFTPASQVQSTSRSQSQSQAALEDENYHVSRVCQRLLVYISKHRPTLFVPHVPAIVKTIVSDESDPVVDTCIRLLAAVTKTDPKVVPHNE